MIAHTDRQTNCLFMSHFNTFTVYKTQLKPVYKTQLLLQYETTQYDKNK